MSMAVRREGEFDERECQAAWLSVLDSLESRLTRREDFVTMLQQAGRNPSQKMVAKYWTQHKQHMGFREFCDVLHCEKPQTVEDLTRAFRKIDINGDGYITHNELKRVLTKHGEKMSDEEVKLLIKEADVNHDGKLDYQEFCHMVMSTSRECQSNALKKLAEKEKPKPSKSSSSTGAKGSPRKNKQKKQPLENGVDYGYLEQSDDEPTSVSAKERKSSVPKVSSGKVSPVTSPRRPSSVSSSPKRAPAEKPNQTVEKKHSLKISVTPPAVSVEEFVVSEGSDMDEDDLIVVAPSGRGKLESRSETVLSAGGLSTDAIDKLKSKSTTLLKKGQKEPALDLSVPGSHSASVSKGKKSKVKEPKNLKSWHKARGKGCFYLHESNILSHRYRLELPCASAIYITVNPAAAEVLGRSPVDVTLLVVGKASDDSDSTDQLVDFTDTQKSKKPSLRTDLRAETYHILSFTTGCRLKKRVAEPTEEKTLLDETGDFTLDTRHALDEIFNRVDLDGDGKLSRDEFNYFQNLTSGEECDDETWEIIKENFEVTQQNRLTKKGFHDLHKETVKDEQGGVSELWDTLQAMGYNKTLQLDEAWPFEFDVYCDQCKPDLSVSGFEAEDRKLEAAVVASVSSHSDRIPVKGRTGLIIHKFTGDSRFSLAVENMESEVVSVTVDCTGSSNSVSNQSSLKYTVEVLPQETQIAHHLMADDWKKSWKPKWTVGV